MQLTQTKNALVYRRVSTDHQDDSLLLQEKRINDYALFKKLTIDESLTFSDPDTSGRIPFTERNGGRALIHRLQLGDIKHVVVAKLDRIGRNVRDALGVLEFFFANGVTLHITDFGGETITTQGHMGKLILTVLLAVAEWEAGEIRDRTTKTMLAKFNRNELVGNVPFGFRGEYTFDDGTIELADKALNGFELAERMAAHGKIVSKLLVPDEAEQAIIRQLHAWRETERLPGVKTSYTAVAALANAAGYRTKQGASWQCGHVSSVLNNRYTQRLLQTSAPAEEDVETAPLATEPANAYD